MQFKLYLGITGDKTTIDDFSGEANLVGSEVRVLAPKGVPLQGSPLWLWRTRYADVVSNFPEDKLRDFLQEHKCLFPIIDKYRSGLTEIFATVIAEYDENEKPRGYSFSLETLQLLSEAGASLEIDSVWAMALDNARKPA